MALLRLDFEPALQRGVCVESGLSDGLPRLKLLPLRIELQQYVRQVVSSRIAFGVGQGGMGLGRGYFAVGRLLRGGCAVSVSAVVSVPFQAAGQHRQAQQHGEQHADFHAQALVPGHPAAR